MTNDEPQTIVDALAHATRSRVGHVTDRQLDQGWESLEHALGEGKYPKVRVEPTPRRWWIPALALAAVVLLGVAVHRLQPDRQEERLHYVVEGAAVGPGGTIQTASEGSARLLFSDSSEVRLAPATKLAVVALTPHGSHIALADGQMETRIRHQSATAWRFDAGPFCIKVVGTAFHLAFNAERGRMKLEMQSGVVEVQAPHASHAVTLRAGESIELFAEPESGTRSPNSLSASAHETATPPPVAPRPENPPAEEERSPARPRPPVRRPPPHIEAPDPRATAVSWAQAIAHGDFATVVNDAESRGLDGVLAGASAADLNALADAARYVGRNDLARQALLGLRARFPGTARASDAAFFLGRLAETTPASTQASVRWYETYLGESRGGPYASEALGREMAILARTDRRRASTVAATYLERFPHGSQAELARSLLSPP